VPVCASCGHETAEDANFCPKCGTPYEAAPTPREQRKIVTVVFCDVTDSTALGESTDPETLRALLARYFERMKGIVEAHGGSVEKFIGDAVMAVFGVPLAHEDDALRACRAAVEMRDALPELGINGRIGVNTGEVVTGTEERLATGDAVNVAARLEQAAAPGEVLVGAETFRLVRAAVEVGEERRLELKGKAELVPAYPVLGVTGELERRFATAMVGRERELQGLKAAYARALEDRSCQLFTILGSAGVGKSRLAVEFLATLDAGVVRGRCLSYGEGITYWPVVEILKQLGTLPDGDAARPLRSLLGETDAAASAEEIAWGFRKLLEQEAQDHPLVVVFDDLHWAEETLLDLVEHVADLSRDASILLLCMARPELLERRPSWGGGKWNASTVLLEPLDAAETEQLLGELGGVGDELRDRILQVAEGNPLFLEEMLALVHDSGGAEVEVPPTIHALLAARLDQLDPAERSVLEHGSVEGRTFHKGAVAALADDHSSVDQRLVALVRKELVRPDRTQLPGDDAYRFRHLLIRDAAYDALPKSTRADAHQRFARWLEAHGQTLVELDEILGYHLEQAARYLAELGRPDPELMLEAGDRLAEAGRRAWWRNDNRAACGLLGRALTLTRALRLDVRLELDLAAATFPDDVRAAQRIAEDAGEAAAAAGDEAGSLLARTVAGRYGLFAGQGSADDLERLARTALPLLEAEADHRGLAEVWHALALGVANMRCRFEDWAVASEHAIHHARLASPRDASLYGLPAALMSGPRPAGKALETLDSLLPEQPFPAILAIRAVLLAMLDREAEAQEVATAAEERQKDLGRRTGLSIFLYQLALFGGDDETAAARLRVACAELEEIGNRAGLSSFAPLLGRALCGLGLHEEAESLSERGRELGSLEDVLTQTAWRQTGALVLSARARHAEAERLAREAVEVADRADDLSLQGNACWDLAQVLEAAGHRDEAVTALADALDRYTRKEIIPLARRVRERLSALQETAI
jgi:class 3 adenylate cyclase/tetratricopeptide (TPR) repeat protein